MKNDFLPESLELTFRIVNSLDVGSIEIRLSPFTSISLLSFFQDTKSSFDGIFETLHFCRITSPIYASMSFGPSVIVVRLTIDKFAEAKKKTIFCYMIIFLK